MNKISVDNEINYDLVKTFLMLTKPQRPGWESVVGWWLTHWLFERRRYLFGIKRRLHCWPDYNCTAPSGVARGGGRGGGRPPGASLGGGAGPACRGEF